MTATPTAQPDEIGFRPTVRRVTTDDATTQRIDLAPLMDKVLMDVFSAMHRLERRSQGMVIGNPANSPADRCRERTELLQALLADDPEIFEHDLADDDGSELIVDLYEAQVEPERCTKCQGQRYATQGDLCGPCHDEAERAEGHFLKVVGR